MATIAPFIRAMGEPATLRTRTLGAPRRAPTQWQTETYAESTIYVIIKELQTREIDAPGGRITEKRLAFYCATALNPMDEINWHGDIYEVESEGTPHYLLGAIGYYNYVGVLIN